MSRHQGPHQDEHGWPSVNTTTRPWRSAPPSPPPGIRHTGIPTHPGSFLTLVPTSFLIPLPRSTSSWDLSPPFLGSPLHPLTSDHQSLITSPCCPSLSSPSLSMSPPSPPLPISLSPTPPFSALELRSASLLSLQTELLLDLVAEAQSRRLEEQRATFHAPQNPPGLTRAPPRPLEDREQLYSTILSHQVRAQASWSFGPVLFGALPLLLPRPLLLQALVLPSPSHVSCMSLTSGSFQGLLLLAPHQHPLLPPSPQCQRMEAQRSEPPLPPGGQELLELLLRVQGGGRMEEQRSQPPTHTC